MHIETETFGHVLVAHTPDEITEDTAGPFMETLNQSVDAGQIFVVLQMDRSELFDSAGLTALVELQDELRERMGKLSLSELSETGKRVLDVTQLDRQFDIFESLLEAVGSMQE